MSNFQWITIIPALPILLVYLAGAVAAIVLLVRKRGTPAILALVGFGVLFLTRLLNLFNGPLAAQLVQGNYRNFSTFSAAIGCCCSIFDVAAVVCLIVALWQAVVGGKEAPPPPPPSVDYTRRDVELTPEPPSVAAPPPPPARSYQTQMLAEEPEEAEWTEESGATAKMADAVEPPAEPDAPRKTQVLGELLNE